MPLYEYECHECGLRFERRQGFNESPIVACPECGGVVQRLIHPVGVIFKGSGFYVTDNRAKSSTKIPTKSEKDGGSEEKKSATDDKATKPAAEAAPAAKPEAANKD